MSFSVGFEGSFGEYEVSPRGLLSNLLCNMVCVMGIIIKCSPVRPKVVKSVHYCPLTNEMMAREYRDGTSLNGLPTTSVYPTKDANGNLLETEFGLCEYKDYQVITIQEAPEIAPLGQLPRSVDVMVEKDLVDKCKPGDRVKVMGCYRALAGKKSATVSGVFKTVVIANNVQVLGKEIQGIVMTTNDLVNVRELAKRHDVFDILSRSIAPSIFGHEMIKQALLLQLLGGVEKNLENSTHLRGDINILMVGDPSTAKSQLLRFVRNLAPLAVNTTGRGSSGVGLTAAVTRDPETHEKRLEAGAMVLADRGIVCIDEFDKMSEADRVAIHEVMEQQTVTVAKAGIHATLNARCSVLAAANPIYGQYNKNKSPQENIGLPDSLLSRFDLLFIVLDKLDRKMDRHISEHVLRIHRYQKPGQEGVPLSLSVSSCTEFQMNSSADEEEKDVETSVWQKYNPLLHGSRHVEVLTMDILKKYIYYAKTRYNPKLTDAAIETISQGYSELRNEQTIRTLPVTARTLETLIRLSSAHAKARLSKDIEEKDAEKAMELIKFALYHDTKDENGVNHQDSDEEIEEEEEEVEFETTPGRKRDRSQLGTTKSLSDRIRAVLLENESSNGEGMHLDTFLEAVNATVDGSAYATSKQVVDELTKMEDSNEVLYDRTNKVVVRV